MLIPSVLAISLSKDAQIQNTCLGYNFTIIENSTLDYFIINSTCAGDVNNITLFVNPTLLAIKNTNATGKGILQVSGTNMLLSFSNGTNVYPVTGDYNSTLSPGMSLLALDNFNLTEGVTRAHSPVWFSSSTNTNKHIANNASNTIPNLTVLFNVDSCSTVGKITYTTNSGTKTVYYPSDYTCSDSIVTINLNVEPASSSNELEIEYGCDNSARTGFRLVILISSLMLPLIIVLYLRNKDWEMTGNDLLIIFLTIVICITLWLVAGQNVAGICGVVT